MLLTRIAAFAALFLAICACQKVEARPTSQNIITCNMQGCSDRVAYEAPASNKRTRKARIENGDGVTILPHPAGCPRVAFCGCGVALKVFGKAITRGTYAIAAYWKHLPRTSAAPGMVAIFGNHHVAYIESVDGDGNATLYDPNSGKHQTRRHTKSIRGAIIVNPNGAMAMN